MSEEEQKNTSEEIRENEEQVSDEATPAVQEEGRRPWMVAEVEKGDFHIIQDGFKLQSEADEWIRNHILDNQQLCSIRKGKAFEAVRKTTEIEF